MSVYLAYLYGSEKMIIIIFIMIYIIPNISGMFYVLTKGFKTNSNKRMSIITLLINI